MKLPEPHTKNQLIRVPEIKFPDQFHGVFPFYLSHPFASRNYVRQWELEFEDRNPGIALVNPFYDVEGEGREDVIARDEGKDFEKTPGYDSRLVRRDLIAMLFSRGIVGIVDENAGESFGTKMEFVYSRVFSNNPKLLICTSGHHEHSWFKTHFHRIYKSFEEFEDNVESQVRKVKEEWGF